MARLRAPDGCIWDREQTHQSIRDCLVEECAELLDAIDREDYPHMREELGDMLLQVFFHAQIAEEAGRFTIEDIAKEIDDKLITENEYDTYREDREFWEHLWKEIESWDTGNLKPNEKKVYEAIKILLSNPDSIEIFNKKAIYLYLREITGLNTKQVVNNLNKLRNTYATFKKKWNKGEF